MTVCTSFGRLRSDTMSPISVAAVNRAVLSLQQVLCPVRQHQRPLYQELQDKTPIYVLRFIKRGVTCQQSELEGVRKILLFEDLLE